MTKGAGRFWAVHRPPKPVVGKVDKLFGKIFCRNSKKIHNLKSNLVSGVMDYAGALPTTGPQL
jgi:hypothetical protein